MNPFIHEPRKTFTDQERNTARYFCDICGSEITTPHGRARARRRGYGYCSSRCHGNALVKSADESVAMRVLSRVEMRGDNECWPFQGRTHKSYGVIDYKGRPVLAHRLVYHIVKCTDPGDRVVCHSCDNPICCNPGHLWLGTQADNVQDMWLKGRGRTGRLRGEAHRQAVLSEAHVRDIRSSADSAKDLATRFGVTRTQIYNVRKGRAWRHVDA